MRLKRVYIILLICLIPAIAMLTQRCSTANKPDPRGEAYAGSAKCARCHQAVYNSFFKTPHVTTSRTADVHHLHGTFTAGHNTFLFSDDSKVVMEKRGDSLYQVEYENGVQKRAEHFDITFGGEKAETYLYWRGNQLFELPMSYFNALQSWTNSPGYATRRPYFDRPIIQRCLECHSSYIEQLPVTSLANQDVMFKKESLVYGIDCERCHGPGANHVNFHTDYPEEKKPRYIVRFAALTRAQKLDACAACHSGGNDVFQESLFRFKMGDTLAKFKVPSFSHPDPNPATLDVHGNQNSLLAASKCFIMSNMDCSTCHDTHSNAKATLFDYSARCIKCHNEANHNFCTMGNKLGTTMKTNCIDCHMPQKPSAAISIAKNFGERATPYQVRTHHIAVYPEESKKIIAFIEGKKPAN